MADAIENPLFNNLMHVNVYLIVENIFDVGLLPHRMLLLPLDFLVAFCETGQMRDFMTVGRGDLLR